METTLLDYSYGSPRIAPLRTSDIDFGDVFGGPPRGSSIHGSMRYSFTEGADSVAAARRLGKTTSFRDPWASTEQKPVFGGVVEGGSRRWSLQEDFFVDIFGGSESLRSRTPRKHDRDVFSASSRGWRSLSSAWPLPPRAEGFVDPSSEPTQFSLPDKLSNPVDSPAFVSPARASSNDAASNGTTHLHSPKMSVFRFSSRAVRVRDESGNNGPQRLPGALSQRFPCGTDDSLGMAKHEKMDDLEKHTGNPRGDAHSSRFRFSMYKWASKGIPTTDNGPKVLEPPYATPFSIDDRKVTVEGSPWSSENGPGRKRPMGKVKDFIRIFNREAHPGKPRTGIPSEDQSFTKKDNGTSEATEKAYVGRNAAVNDRASVFQLEKPRVHPERVVQVADPCEHSPTENSTTDSNDILFSDTSPGHDTSPGQKDSSASSTASIIDDARATDEDADESSGTYFTVRELAQDESEQVQPTEDCEEIRTRDAKIRQWSRGKEGNIRSLLSTLQYVLWPESGWKPVPLVDVIEGTAVKRSYQKALLCLHPDKLQQRGAASDQKYIAEQVFEILQEAWTHFNGLGLVAP